MTGKVANPEHLEILKSGVARWNEWRAQHPDVRPYLYGADLRDADLRQANLYKAFLSHANLTGADLAGAKLDGASLTEGVLCHTNLSRAYLTGVDFYGANLQNANLSRANLIGTHLLEADLRGTNLSRACLVNARLEQITTDERTNFSNADLRGATILESSLAHVDLSGCHVYGVSVWNVDLNDAKQNDLLITHYDEPPITLDNLAIAQFVYLLLRNSTIRSAIDTIARKVVLILGRFALERKNVLDAVRGELRRLDYVPILFDFEGPSSRDLTETVRTLAHLSRFVIADLSDPRCLPHELLSFVPDLAVPTAPLLLQSQEPYAMFSDLRRKYHWVLKPFRYESSDQLTSALAQHVIAPAEAKADELARGSAGS